MIERVREALEIAPKLLNGGDVRITIIRAGRTAGGERYYKSEALRRAVEAGVYDNAKMFINHRDPAADARRGHRDMYDWTATIRPGSVAFVNDEVIARAHPHSADLRALLADPLARKQVGVSQDADIEYHRATAPDGKPAQVVEDITQVYSVDWVPTGNAGGRVCEALCTAQEAAESAAARAERQLRARLGARYGPRDVDRLVAARPFTPDPPDPFAEQCRRWGVTDPDEIERLRNAR